MKQSEGVTTSSTLIRRLGDPADGIAWVEFAARYLPLLHLWCQRAGLDHHAAEDVSQRLLIELSQRMRNFCYDPAGSFRGWLWTFCQRRMIDEARRRRRVTGSMRVFSDMPPSMLDAVCDQTEAADDEVGLDPRVLDLLRVAEEAQTLVRKRVAPRIWQAFELVALKGNSIQDTAETVGMSYAAVYAARGRVLRMLREEGDRLRTNTPGARE